MSDSVTVSLLPVSLSIVHIPRSRLHSLCHPLLRQILLPKPTFLNITCNELELSLFAEHHVLEDFEPVAHKDARKLRARGRDPLVSPKGCPSPANHKGTWEPIEISSERWNVLQIDSHSDTLDKSGARVHELSAPLAAAGISILYQSSYMSDFIFVKEHRLTEVMTLLGSAGFDLYSSDAQNLTSQLSALTSPVLSPLTGAVDDNSSINFLDLSAPVSSITPENGAVLTRSRSSSENSIPHHPSLHMSTLQDAFVDKLARNPSNEHLGSTTRPITSRSQSHSPSHCEVRILEPDLTCIGLSDDNADMWAIKIIKLVAFPDLIPPSEPPSRQRRRRLSSPYSGSSEGVRSHHSRTSLQGRLHGLEDDLGHGLANFGIHSECESESGSRSDDTTRVGTGSPKDPAMRFSSESPIFDLEHKKPWDEDAAIDEREESSSEDGYFSASPNVRSPVESEPPFSLVGGGEPKAHQGPRHVERPPLPHLVTVSPKGQSLKSRTRSTSGASMENPPSPPLVPFFSFTRTPEGSSLTGSVSLLAALFPRSERHMVICSGELDDLDSRESFSGDDYEDAEDPDDGSDDGDCDGGTQGPLKCLQIDLQKYGLDKHGLISRFSRTLEENEINHMYSSTYKTANLLVDKAHASRAQALLLSC